MDQLTLELTDTADSALFDRFFAEYELAFTLPEETESRQGFARCLELNHGSEHLRLSSRYGAFQELCVVATDPVSEEMVGGANFIALAPMDAGAPVTVNLNYLYVCSNARGKGVLRSFLRSISALAGSLFGASEGAQVAIFIEQNDPFRMSQEAYERDSQHSGMDQFARLQIWSRMGARVVDFPYVQPPLSQDQDADDTLVYSVMGLPGNQLEPAVLRQHLEGFFGISVLKGAPLDSATTVNVQLGQLEAMVGNGEAIALLDPSGFLTSLTDPSRLLERQDRPQDLRSALSSPIR